MIFIATGGNRQTSALRRAARVKSSLAPFFQLSFDQKKPEAHFLQIRWDLTLMTLLSVIGPFDCTVDVRVALLQGHEPL